MRKKEGIEPPQRAPKPARMLFPKTVDDLYGVPYVEVTPRSPIPKRPSLAARESDPG